ncbi:MAG: hypothetical protein L6243_05795 [Candidatus Altiarchaeales archaeon]|nr:glucose-6-phosphate isomerase [Candidatus Altiarchaeota archaeon]MBU4265815.1 glucose-6-phosphate isomerase [Candidatus Altiarchaeota archaeon]MBU4341163.1 glucose-6-phosphate isomerase [Candidatus Altiarchaeota archaeon]MBU4437146.1 glucose-6-phosphate isomerase [Candidatus Altiarchaeota archaeon]MCG2783084.1 hypothetical protein [Candidatus Altiarchaeales archaeon]
MDFSFGGQSLKPDIRWLSDMLDVIYDREWLDSVQNPEEVELYYMYRDLALSDEDRELMQNNKLRYDITVIPPLNLGKEFVKTKGHCHPPAPANSLSYPELYEVLEGEAHYLLQKEDDVILVSAQMGDKVVIPPKYCHITINPSSQELRMANFVSTEFESDYGSIIEKKGGAYFELTDGKVIGNKNYQKLPELRKLEPRELDIFGLNEFKQIYDIIKEVPDILEFLNSPEKHY